MKIHDFKIERFFAEYEFNAPYLLCCSDCQSYTVHEILSMEPGAKNNFQEMWLGYSESLGSPELRKEIAALYSNCGPNHILVYSGAEEAIFCFMNTALDKGDHIIVHFPCYQSLFEVADSVGCEVTKWQTREDENWDLDIDFLKKNIKDNTKAIVINCPHNPTGYLMPQENFQEIINIARDHHITIFSDEVYRFLEYDETDRLPALCDEYSLGISLGVMSKAFGLAGLRIGWIATQNKNLYDKLASFKDYTTICSSAPSEFISTVALKHKDNIISRNLNIIKNNLNILNDFFTRHRDRFNWSPPKAGPIAFPSLKSVENIEKFCHDLVEKKGVLLLPGTVYQKPSDNFRIGFGRNNLDECINRLDEYLINQ